MVRAANNARTDRTGLELARLSPLLGAGGRRFESCCPDQLKYKDNFAFKGFAIPSHGRPRSAPGKRTGEAQARLNDWSGNVGLYARVRVPYMRLVQHFPDGDVLFEHYGNKASCRNASIDRT